MAITGQTAPILDLTTDRPRYTVRIDGPAYQLRDTSDLTIQQYRTLERLAPRTGLLLANEQPSDADSVELDHLLDAICRIALDAPDPVHAKLRIMERIAIFNVFTELSLPSLLRMRALPTVSPADGTTSSRASRGSTGATRARGRRTSRSAPSARTSK